MDPAVERKSRLKASGDGLLSLVDFVVTLVALASLVLGLLFALVLGGLVVGALAALLTGNSHQGLVVGAALTGWTCLVIGMAVLARRGRRRSYPDGSAVAHSESDSPGLKELVREGASLLARLVGLAAICALAPAVVAGALTGNVLTAIAVGIVAFPVVLVQGLVVLKVEG